MTSLCARVVYMLHVCLTQILQLWVGLSCGTPAVTDTTVYSSVHLDAFSLMEIACLNSALTSCHQVEDQVFACPCIIAILCKVLERSSVLQVYVHL